MILRPKAPARLHGTLPGTAAIAPVPVPGWLRRAVPDAQSLVAKNLEDVALAAGAALGGLDAVVRRQERWAGAWRQRLALAAAAVTARQAGRNEDEAALRDAVLLTRPGDDVGPAGRMLLAWRRLAARPAQESLAETGIAGVLEALGLAHDDETASDLADALRQLATTEGAVGMLTGAYALVERRGLPSAVGAWLADALLAQRLGWTHAVPLLGSEATVGKSSGRARLPVSIASVAAAASERPKLLLAAQARATVRAIDLFGDLDRRAEKLLAVAPKLRAKAAALVVGRLLSDDALVPSEKIAGMSDRGLRRLFDRLVELGAVRELSGRPAFRVYGL
ncbi:hypothetical protein C7I87_33230 [Mesorhizobium sp. SARCC-RB16n]|uniref:DUF1403 family protein n=1 Tax=Mesorhizobium sp. SARCC-RB16n TaxID=2116687 RepID=UPI00122FB11A|nr:DUF1403 family protein [Mesorhizobium sp. SARCC-RB16n]KAA3441903.1 hypothetical protein C7I87_33230 [Mesorhizobium sp. SARCC-RB16n]